MKKKIQDKDTVKLEEEAVKKITKLDHLGNSDSMQAYKRMLSVHDDPIYNGKVLDDLRKSANYFFPGKQNQQNRRMFLKSIKGVEDANIQYYHKKSKNP